MECTLWCRLTGRSTSPTRRTAHLCHPQRCVTGCLCCGCCVDCSSPGCSFHNGTSPHVLNSAALEYCANTTPLCLSSPRFCISRQTLHTVMLPLFIPPFLIHMLLDTHCGCYLSCVQDLRYYSRGAFNHPLITRIDGLRGKVRYELGSRWVLASM